MYVNICSCGDISKKYYRDIPVNWSYGMLNFMLDLLATLYVIHKRTTISKVP